MKKTRKYHDIEIKRRAVEAYVSGARSAADVAAELGISAALLYRWRVQLDEAEKGARIDELEGQGHSPEDAKRILSLELEVEEYKKKLAEQVLINDLLKKLQVSKNSLPESELTGLIKTSRDLDRKRKPAK